MTELLHVENLSGGYASGHPILHNVSFQVKEGEIVALLGLNGAGKSTLIKHILGFMKPFSGNIRIKGKTVTEDPQAYRKQYAYIPEIPVYYEHLTLMEHLFFAGKVYGLKDQVMRERIPVLLKEFRMTGKEDLYPAHFSKGMKQKMMIMIALLIRPSLYVIDEPLLGLDPVGIRSLLTFLESEKKRGAGILMSTHILSTAERYCDQFLILHQGRIIANGTLGQLRHQAGDQDASLDDLYLQLIDRGEG